MATLRSRDPVDEVLLTALRWAMAISVRAADELGDLSPVQLRALTVLQESPGTNLNDLASAMGVTVSTSSRLVDRLGAAGPAGGPPGRRRPGRPQAVAAAPPRDQSRADPGRAGPAAALRPAAAGRGQ